MYQKCIIFLKILVAMEENNSLANRKTEKVGNIVINNDKNGREWKKWKMERKEEVKNHSVNYLF